MFQKISMKLMRLGLASIFALGLFGFAVNSASAATISITSNDTSNVIGTLTYDLGDVVGYFCDAGEPCQSVGDADQRKGDFNDSGTDFTQEAFLATAINFIPSSPAREEEVGQQVTQDPNLEFFSKDESPNAGDFDITTLYFSLTLGNETAFFKNLSDGTLLGLIYTNIGGEGSGLSHVTQFIPLPASLPLFAAGLGLLGLLGLRRRRRNGTLAS